MGRWMAIKNKKAASDAKKGVALARYSREIMSAARQGGGDPSSNFRLRGAIDAAKAGGLSKDNIENAIAKATGALKGEDLESLSYEGYGPAGVAIFIECETDNRNRTAGDIRSYFNKHQGNLGQDGCVAFMFEPFGRIVLEMNSEAKALQWMDWAIEADAHDVQMESENGFYYVEIITEAKHLNTVCHTLSEIATEPFLPETVELTRLCATQTDIEDPIIAKALIKLLNAIEDHDDVNRVYHNAHLSEALWQACE
ncbi:MAG: YebC/PmpR family DNA-binding transcriptional regulator [Vampirovibrio sp.]